MWWTWLNNVHRWSHLDVLVHEEPKNAWSCTNCRTPYKDAGFSFYGERYEPVKWITKYLEYKTGIIKLKSLNRMNYKLKIKLLYLLEKCFYKTFWTVLQRYKLLDLGASAKKRNIMYLCSFAIFFLKTEDNSFL